MALITWGEIIVVVARRIAPIDARLAHRGDVSGCRGCRMWWMAIAAFRDCLSLFQSMRHVIVWAYLLAARRYIAEGHRDEFIERPVTTQTHVVGDFGGGGAANPGAQSQRERKHPDTYRPKASLHYLPHPFSSVRI
jgi:hypothetical protein